MTSSLFRSITPLAAGLLLISGVPQNLQAAVIINVVESGNDVIFSGNGTLDVSNLTSQGSGNLLAGIDFGAEVLIGGDPSGFPAVDFYGATGELSIPPVFGADQFTVANLGTGPRMGIAFSAFANQVAPAVVVPAGYVSGTQLSSTSTYAGQSFASLGLIPGTYVWSWSDDSLTLNIAQVPVPAAVWLFGSALSLLGWQVKRKAT